MIDPENRNSPEVSQTIVWSLTRSELLELLSVVSQILNNLIFHETISKNPTQEYDYGTIVRTLLNRYFIENDFFNMSEIVAQKDVHTFQKVLSLCTDLLYLCNNGVTETVDQIVQNLSGQHHQQNPLVILGGLDKSFIQIAMGFHDMDKKITAINHPIEITDNSSESTDESAKEVNTVSVIPLIFWQTITWSMKLVAQCLK